MVGQVRWRVPDGRAPVHHRVRQHQLRGCPDVSPRLFPPRQRRRRRRSPFSQQERPRPGVRGTPQARAHPGTVL